jgi:hypothetical protein
MANNRRAGVMNLQVNGEVFDAVGSFTVNYGQPKREELVGPDRVHGYKELPQSPSCSGEIRDSKDVRLIDALLNATNATVTIKFANGKTFMMEEAYYCGDGNLETEEGKIQFEMKGMSAEEIPA